MSTETLIYCTYTLFDGPDADNTQPTLVGIVEDERECAAAVEHHLAIEHDGEFGHHKPFLVFGPQPAAFDIGTARDWRWWRREAVSA